jgi:hypothetical protein
MATKLSNMDVFCGANGHIRPEDHRTGFAKRIIDNHIRSNHKSNRSRPNAKPSDVVDELSKEIIERDISPERQMSSDETKSIDNIFFSPDFFHYI